MSIVIRDGKQFECRTEKKGKYTINVLMPVRTPEEQELLEKEQEENLKNLWLSIRKKEIEEEKNALNNLK